MRRADTSRNDALTVWTLPNMQVQGHVANNAIQCHSDVMSLDGGEMPFTEFKLANTAISLNGDFAVHAVSRESS